MIDEGMYEFYILIVAKRFARPPPDQKRVVPALQNPILARIMLCCGLCLKFSQVVPALLGVTGPVTT